MGIFDWLKKRSQQTDEIRRVMEVMKSSFDELTSSPPAPSRSRPPVSARSTPRPAPRSPDVHVHHVPDRARWIAPGESIRVQGYDIPGGLLYLGTRLTAPKETPEPALIDPDLSIDRAHPDTAGRHLDYWPSFAEIPPASRATYLAWLADGRRAPATPIGYVFLFLYGLERRVLVDIAANPQLATELLAIRTEVATLLDHYGSLSSSFQGYATGFLGVIDLMTVDDSQRAPLAPPPLHGPKEPTPLSLRIALGRFAAAGQPVPPEWALAWAWYHPEVSPRTPATRCPDEFERLFLLRYRKRFGEGLIVKPGKRRIAIRYQPANSGIETGTLSSATIPDVFPLMSPGRKLVELFTNVADELDPYSRWLGRNPDKAGSLAALALLPPELVDASGVSGQARELTAWANGLLDVDGVATVSGSDLMRFWPSVSPEKLSRAEGIGLVQALARLRLGIEPDLRFGGPAIAREGPVVLFRTGEHPPEASSSAYAMATLLIYLAAIVGSSDGNVSEREIGRLREHLDLSLNLTPAEQRRLDAHLAWLATIDLKLTGLKKRINALGTSDREAIGAVLIAVAVSDGIISPPEVTTLMKTFKLLGLDPEAVTSRLHATLTAGPPRPARGPVTVRPAGTPDPGFPIPPRPGQAGKSTAPTDGFVLDHEAIRRKMADTAVLSALLGSIFTEEVGTNVLQWEGDTPSEADRETAADAAKGDLIGGLDAAHSGLLRQLATRESWDSGEFETLARSFHLMPDGALDVLNEAAFEVAEEPLIEGDDPLAINHYALNAMLA